MFQQRFDEAPFVSEGKVAVSGFVEHSKQGRNGRTLKDGPYALSPLNVVAFALSPRHPGRHCL